MSRSKYSTPELMKMPAKEIYLKSDDDLVKIAQQLTSVVNKRINRMHDEFGDGSYKYVTDFEDKYSERKDFRSWDRDKLELYVKASKNFLKAKTTKTDYTELVEKKFAEVSDLFVTESDDVTINDKAVLVRNLFDALDQLKEEYPKEFSQYGSDQELQLIAESFQYYDSKKINVKDMPLLIKAMKEHKTIKQLKQEEYEKENVDNEKENVDNASDIEYDTGGFWGIK